MESAMDVFENRLESFTNWPKGLFLRPQIMAAAGFFHTNWDSDEVQCFNCAIVIDNWQPDDDPFKQHLSAAPNCSFVNKTYMSNFEDRLASFYAWPLDEKPLPIHMAAAGFFHTNRSSDAATCFCCTLRLECWERADDPIQRHMEVLNQTRRRPCTWLDKITTPPEKVSGPTPQRVAARWNHSTAPPKPQKCGVCHTVYSSGNQLRRHLLEAGHLLPRKPNMVNPPPASGSGVNKPRRVSSRQQGAAIHPRQRERPSTDSSIQTLAASDMGITPTAAPAGLLASEERRRNPPGTTGFLGSHRVMKSTVKPRPNARANTGVANSTMDRITGLLKQEDDPTRRQYHEPSRWHDAKLPPPVQVTPTGPRVTRVARQEQVPPPPSRSEWEAQRQPRQESLIGDYGEPAGQTDWNSTGLESSSGW